MWWAIILYVRERVTYMNLFCNVHKVCGDISQQHFGIECEDFFFFFLSNICPTVKNAYTDSHTMKRNDFPGKFIPHRAYTHYAAPIHDHHAETCSERSTTDLRIDCGAHQSLFSPHTNTLLFNSANNPPCWSSRSRRRTLNTSDTGGTLLS